jgi:inner membrane protein
MDSITHITLGACIGEIVLGKKLGKKALFWGALSQSLPDIDSIGALFFPADQALLIHRGITHSMLFAIVAGLILAFTVNKIYHNRSLSFSLLAFFFCGQIALHDLLDTCNSYGTALLEPISHHRFSINLLYVADPFFTFSLAIATLFLIFRNVNNKGRPAWALIAIGICAFYLIMAGVTKTYINHRAEISFRSQKITQSDYFSTPAPFNSMLWYIVAAADSGYYTGYSSIFDSANKLVTYDMHPKNYALLKTKTEDQRVLGDLTTFADNYYTISRSADSLYFNVLRFEQIQGWDQKNAPFALSYPLSAGHNQATLLQRGRLAGWNKTTIQQYIERILGDETANLQPSK